MPSIKIVFIALLLMAGHNAVAAGVAFCQPGYWHNGENCEVCTAGYFCAGGKKVACADATGGRYKYSETGTSDVTQCYLVTAENTYVDTPRGELVPCAVGNGCPGERRVFYGLPDGYIMTKYTKIINNYSSDATSENFNGVNTEVPFADADAIEFIFSTTDANDERKMFVAADYGTGGLSKTYIASGGDIMYSNFSAVLVPVYTKAQIVDGAVHGVRAGFSNTDTKTIYFGSWVDKYWSRTMDWYGFKIYKDDMLLRNLIPCVRSVDNVAGFYDTVNDKFYTNHKYGAIPFAAGDVMDDYGCPDGLYYTAASACNKCPDGLQIPPMIHKSRDVGDCGRLLNIGEYKLYLRSRRRTQHALGVKFGDILLYSDAVPGQECGRLRVKYNDTIYSICNTDID